MTSIYLIFCTVHGGLHEINQIGALSHIMGYEELHGVTSVSVILGIERVVQLFNSEFSIHTNDGIAPPCESHIWMVSMNVYWTKTLYEIWARILDETQIVLLFILRIKPTEMGSFYFVRRIVSIGVARSDLNH